MDTVFEASMAALGGISILHCNNTAAEQSHIFRSAKVRRIAFTSEPPYFSLHDSVPSASDFGDHRYGIITDSGKPVGVVSRSSAANSSTHPTNLRPAIHRKPSAGQPIAPVGLEVRHQSLHCRVLHRICRDELRGIDSLPCVLISPLAHSTGSLANTGRRRHPRILLRRRLRRFTYSAASCASPAQPSSISASPPCPASSISRPPSAHNSGKPPSVHT